MRNILSAVIGVSLTLSTGMVLAVDTDIMINDVQRRAAIVAPQCAAITSKKIKSSALDDYRKGLCLLYGVNGAAQPENALPLLRKASGKGLVEAQLALADTLQKGNKAMQIEALVWYKRAERAGDTRAGVRYDRLAQRIGAVASLDNTNPDPPPDAVVNPTSGEMQSLYRQGYHCHVMRFAQKWCHSAMD